MFGGCGAPVVPSAAALSTSSSRHLVTAATEAMETAPGAAEPALAPGLGLRRVGHVHVGERLPGSSEHCSFFVIQDQYLNNKKLLGEIFYIPFSN